MTDNVIKLLKVAYRNVLVSLSDARMQSALRNDKSFQQVFLTQLSIYNFLSDTFNENGDFDAPSGESQQVSDEKTKAVEEFCQRNNFSPKTNQVLDFLRRFNEISRRNCVIKNLAIRSTEMSDIQDDLNYFSVFVNNSLNIDLNELSIHSVNNVNNTLNSMPPSSPPLSAFGDEQQEPEKLPSFNDFADIGRNSWIDSRANAQLLREILENRIYLFTSKPKSVIILKWISLFVLGLASLVHVLFLTLVAYLLVSAKNNGGGASAYKQLGSLTLWICFVLSITTYFFCREVHNMYLSIKGNGRTSALLATTANANMSRNKNKIFNNDNIKFYFNWRTSLFCAVFSLLFLSTPVGNFISSVGSSDPLDIIDFSLAVAYIVAYCLIGMVVIAAIVINPKKDVQRIIDRKYEIRREVSNQISDSDSVPPTQH